MSAKKQERTKVYDSCSFCFYVVLKIFKKLFTFFAENSPLYASFMGEKEKQDFSQKAAKRINMALFGKNQDRYGGMIIEKSD